MKKILFSYYFLIHLFAEGQNNLVANPSFESYSSCPNSQAQLDRCINWSNPNINSPDYFNTCSPVGSFCFVPLNFWGFQNPRTAQAYAEFTPRYGSSQGREYVEGKFSDSLFFAKRYCVSFFISLSDSSTWATDRIQAYLSPDSIFLPMASVLPYSPQIENPVGNFINDTSGWVLISGTYQASGGERFMTIGNFYNDANTTVNTVRNSPVLFGAIYYIDDVSVIEMIYDTANAGGDTTICEGASVPLGTAQCDGCTYQWFPTAGLSDSTAAQPMAAPSQTTTYVLTLTDTTTTSIDTCVCRSSQTTTDTVTVFVLTSSNIADAGAAQTLCKGESVTLGTAACANCFYQWQPFGELNNSTIAQPTATPTQTTTYTLTLTDSIPPCAKTTIDTVTVFVEPCTEPVEVYNIFTPNGDAHNETFFIKNLPANSSLQIFNRWGSKVYSSSNYNNTWDGGRVPEGTYFYLLTLPTKETLRGFVEIRR
jgi:gliding motility-associated-like protein